MTTRGFVSVAMKLIAVYYLIQTLAGLVGGGFVATVNTVHQLQFGRAYNVLLVLLPGLMLLGLYGLIQWSDFYAAKLIRDDAGFAIPQLALSDLQAALFSAIGLSFVVSAFGELTPLIGYYYVIAEFKYGRGRAFGDIDWLHSSMAGIVLRLGIGLFLFLQPRGLVTLWGRLQNLRGMKDA